MTSVSPTSQTSPPQPRTIESGVRKYVSYSFWHSLRRWWQTRRLGKLGQDVYVEPNVRFLRHPENTRIGNRVILKEGVRICPTNPESTIEIGDWTTIGAHTFIYASYRISIGNNCLIAPFCYFVDSDHGIAEGKLIREQPMESLPITIGNDVWVGTGAVITRGVTIHDGAVIAARAVVTADVPTNAIVAGVPARILRYRT